MPPCITLSFIKNGSRVGGVILRKESLLLLLFLGVDIEKGTSGLLSTTIGQLICRNAIYIYIYITIKNQFFTFSILNIILIL